VTLRRSSILMSISAWTLPPLWAFWQMQTFGEHADETGRACGLPIVGIVLIAAIASALLATVGLVKGVRAYRAIPYPRPLALRIELGALAVPAVLLVAPLVVVLIIG
jgi:hypothetical protein